MEKVGKGNLINYMKKLGGTYTYPQGKSITSAKDLTLYAAKLYAFSQKSANGKELVKYLKSTIYSTTIPAGIKGVEVAHKVGMIPMNLIYNDIAIVYDENPYVLAVTTKNLEYNHSQTVIANIASITHKHHIKKYENNITITTKIKSKDSDQIIVFNQKSKLVDGRLLVPLRQTFEALGVKVDWNQNNKTVTASKGGTTVSIPIYAKQVQVNNRPTLMDVEAQIVNGNVLIPLRFVSEVFNAEIMWDNKNKTVSILK
ncbi:hypothetical protein F7731_10410 [Cytobacillus depressus]|uniref:Uncharacterized protein n=1 Tax=Cytobacillus depressus TaxID=1602942 RepID=A0A6L3V831_9BACI|nr:hypothetical protein F7731_10410 [Cytobacillus depressus]